MKLKELYLHLLKDKILSKVNMTLKSPVGEGKHSGSQRQDVVKIVSR